MYLHREKPSRLDGIILALVLNREPFGEIAIAIDEFWPEDSLSTISMPRVQCVPRVRNSITEEIGKTPPEKSTR